MARKLKEEWASNRDKSRQPRTSKSFWCFGCDRNKIREGERCCVCGTLDRKKRNKK